MNSRRRDVINSGVGDKPDQEILAAFHTEVWTKFTFAKSAVPGGRPWSRHENGLVSPVARLANLCRFSDAGMTRACTRSGGGLQAGRAKDSASIGSPLGAQIFSQALVNANDRRRDLGAWFCRQDRSTPCATKQGKTQPTHLQHAKDAERCESLAWHWQPALSVSG